MKQRATKRIPTPKSVWHAYKRRRRTGMRQLRDQIGLRSCILPKAGVVQVARRLFGREDQTTVPSCLALFRECRFLGKTRMGVGVLSFAGALLLAGCTDVIGNQLGIAGAPSWNVPMQLEGDWSGRAWPDVRALVACLQADSYTVDTAPRMFVAIRQNILTGQLLFADGEAYDLSGETASGASFAGNNLAFAEIRLDGRKVGTAEFEPDGTSGRLAVDLYLKRPASRDQCAMPATLSRVR
ncbi:hypothetical protein ACRDNQ_01830 [Palleronia sp. KMU-117]|uniref:hypothetical protein n=1 Tax=Palleronia sp. KMU-117 TaxID=3434108 RepID=UPI003D723842